MWCPFVLCIGISVRQQRNSPSGWCEETLTHGGSSCLAICNRRDPAWLPFSFSLQHRRMSTRRSGGRCRSPRPSIQGNCAVWSSRALSGNLFCLCGLYVVHAWLTQVRVREEIMMPAKRFRGAVGLILSSVFCWLSVMRKFVLRVHGEGGSTFLRLASAVW